MAAHKVANISELNEGECKTYTVEGQSIAVFNVSGKFTAIDDTCAHRGGSLGSGTLEGDIVTCPLHGWQYDVTTGECKMNPQVTLKSFEVKVDGDSLVLEV